jgi:hypothetical protein
MRRAASTAWRSPARLPRARARLALTAVLAALCLGICNAARAVQASVSSWDVIRLDVQRDHAVCRAC